MLLMCELAVKKLRRLRVNLLKWVPTPPPSCARKPQLSSVGTVMLRLTVATTSVPLTGLVIVLSEVRLSVLTWTSVRHTVYIALSRLTNGVDELAAVSRARLALRCESLWTIVRCSVWLTNLEWPRVLMRCEFLPVRRRVVVEVVLSVTPENGLECGRLLTKWTVLVADGAD